MQKQKKLKDQQLHARKKCSKTISWSNSVTLFHYTECGNPRAEVISIRGIEKLPLSKLTGRQTFQCEADAVISQRRKKLDQHTLRLEKILPELAKLEWSHLSLNEMEAVASDIIEELDSLRQQSREYNLVERQFALLLEAYECMFRLSCNGNHHLPIKQHGKNSEVSFIKSGNRFFRLPPLPWPIPFRNCASFDVDTDAESD
jgi:hypothetical protein